MVYLRWIFLFVYMDNDYCLYCCLSDIYWPLWVVSKDVAMATLLVCGQTNKCFVYRHQRCSIWYNHGIHRIITTDKNDLSAFCGGFRDVYICLYTPWIFICLIHDLNAVYLHGIFKYIYVYPWIFIYVYTYLHRYLHMYIYIYISPIFIHIYLYILLYICVFFQAITYWPLTSPQPPARPPASTEHLFCLIHWKFSI